MNVEEYRWYCLQKKGVTESFPFDEQTLVFKVMNKMFALCGLEHTPSRVNLKCNPERSVALREQYDGQILPGYHMNKLHWNTIHIERNVPDSLIYELIDHSYELIVASLPKKVREELNNL